MPAGYRVDRTGACTCVGPWAEVTREFASAPVIVAYNEDGTDLALPRLVVPGDIKGGRYVTDRVELRLINPAG